MLLRPGLLKTVFRIKAKDVGDFANCAAPDAVRLGGPT